MEPRSELLSRVCSDMLSDVVQMSDAMFKDS